MRKYAVVFRVSLSERMIYRGDFFLSALMHFIPIITTILLWQAIFDGADVDKMGGLRYREMVSYYLLVMVSRLFGSMPRLAAGISTDIRDGELRKYLLQPIDYIGYLFMLRIAHKMMYMLTSLLAYGLVFWLCRDFLPQWTNPWIPLYYITSLILAFFLGFSIHCVLGLLGFWFLEVASFLRIFMTMHYFLSGHMFPLSLLPDWLHGYVLWLPFAYETYYPTMIGLGRMNTDQMLEIVCIQFLWATAMLGLARWMWHRGLRRYAAYGG